MANTKISQLPTWTGTANDLRWFVMNNSGENETYKFSGYTSGLVNGTGVDSVKSADWVTSTYGPAIANGLGSVAIGSQAESTSNFGVAIGWNTSAGDGATAIGASMNSTALCSVGVGYGSNASGQYSVFLGAEGNASGDNSIAMSRFANAYGSGSISIGVNTTSETNGSTCLGNVMLVRNSKYSSTIGGTNNVILTTPGFDYDYNNIFGGANHNINQTSSGSTIVGGLNNTITRGFGSSIISSFSSTQNGGSSPYSNSYVNMFGCIGSDITNSTNTVGLGLSGRTVAGLNNATAVENLYVFGNIGWSVTTVNDAGTVNINVFEDAMTVINVTGGTYNLTITPIPNDPGTEITLMINYVSGTVNFVGSGSVQWKWGNGAGAPTFSANTRSIIKMSTWADNDLWEVSRSMNMS